MENFSSLFYLCGKFFLMIFNCYRLIFLIPLKQVSVNYFFFLRTFPFSPNFQIFDTKNHLTFLIQWNLRVNSFILSSFCFDWSVLTMIFPERLRFFFVAPVFISTLILIIFILLFSLCLFWFPFSNFEFWGLAHEFSEIFLYNKWF